MWEKICESMYVNFESKVRVCASVCEEGLFVFEIDGWMRKMKRWRNLSGWMGMF